MKPPIFARPFSKALVAGSSHPAEVHAAFDEQGAEALSRTLHQGPRDFGKDSTFWTLAAEVSFEQGMTERRVTAETIRATLHRLGVRWKRPQQTPAETNSPCSPKMERSRSSRSTICPRARPRKSDQTTR